ncbi:MAG: AbrB/MazE/SpoVT family DNA-binding domain-containing protein [Candidatus Solibacter sp.]
MATMRSKLTSQGQISVPAEVRRKLGIGPGSILEWEEDGDRMVVRRAGKYTFDDIHKALFGDRKPVPHTLNEMKESIRERMRSRYARR